MTSKDRLIRGTTASIIERVPTDVTAIPSGVSLFAEADWATMVASVGSEADLLAQLGVTYADLY